MIFHFLVGSAGILPATARSVAEIADCQTFQIADAIRAGKMPALPTKTLFWIKFLILIQIHLYSLNGFIKPNQTGSGSHIEALP